MLLYNHNKEFIGIDGEDLKHLGFSSFEEITLKHRDIAELFIKKPGYIHNFTNFPWIDFVMHAESDDAKVIIAGKDKAISATIEILPFYLTSAPTEEAFIIKLKNIQNYQLDASEKPEVTTPPPEFGTDTFSEPEPSVEKVTAPSIPEEILFEEEVVAETPEAIDLGDDLFLDESTPTTNSFDDEKLDIFFEDEEPLIEESVEEEEIAAVPQSALDTIKEDDEAPMLGAQLTDEEKEYLSSLKFDESYVYDPNIAADELGLPTELIDEFIGDFINQAYEFKDQIFNAVAQQDFDTIKVMSHKMKGVAANLRIEDSFEVLRNINESSDIKECEANLKRFYLTIAKLEGKDIEVAKAALEAPTEEVYDLNIEDDILVSDGDEIFEEETFASIQEAPLELDSFEDELSLDLDLNDDHDQIETPSATLEDDDLYDFSLKSDSEEPLIISEEPADEILSEINEVEESVIDEIEETKTTSRIEVPLLEYNINKAATEIGLNVDLVQALVDDYIVETNEIKTKLDEAISTGEVIRWKGLATQLKGVSDNLRIIEVSTTLQKLIAATQKSEATAATEEFYGFINQL